MYCPNCAREIKAWANDRGILIQKAVGLVAMEMTVVETGNQSEHPIKSESNLCTCPRPLA